MSRNIRYQKSRSIIIKFITIKEITADIFNRLIYPAYLRVIDEVKIVWNDKCLDLLVKIVEYDIVRYSDDSMFASLLELHTNKFKYFITKGRYKTQNEFEKALNDYLISFKEISIPNNLVY